MKYIPLLLIVFISGLKADYNSASHAYEQGIYQQAFDEYLSMAKVGEKRSQFNIGVMYFNGQYVNKDINKAYGWMKLSLDDETADQQMIDVFGLVSEKIIDQKAADSEFERLSSQYSSEALLETLYPSFVEPNNENAYEATPIKIEQPRYPRKAAKKGIQGWVKYSFDLDKNGVPRDILLIESTPTGVFDQVASNVIPKWRFEPAIDKNGDRKKVKSLIYTFRFQLKDGSGLELKKKVITSNLAKMEEGDPIAQYNIAYWKSRGFLPKVEANPSELFFKSAQKGLPSAQFHVGKSLIYGKGCIQDKAKGIAWLTRAASNGQIEARELLASVNFEKEDLESQQAGLDYLANVEELSPITKIRLAKLFATSPHESISNPTKSLDIIDDIPVKKFPDKITLYEIRAAAYAKLGKFKKAVKHQKNALEEAEDLGASIEEIKQRLDSYKNKEVANYF